MSYYRPDPTVSPDDTAAAEEVLPAAQEYEDAKYPPTDTKYVRTQLGQALNVRGIQTPPALTELLAILPPGTVIAGGFVADAVLHGRPAKDIDLFFLNAQAFSETVSAIQKEGWKPNERAEVVLADPELIDKEGVLTFRREGYPDVQAIKIAWYQHAEHVVDNFDFTVTQFAIDVSSLDLVAGPLSSFDYARKIICLHRVESKWTLYYRITRYVDKGFLPTRHTLDCLGKAA